MWNFLYKKLMGKAAAKKPNYTQKVSDNLEKKQLSRSLSSNRKVLKEIFVRSIDIEYRNFTIGDEEIPALIVYIDGLSEKNILYDNVIKSLKAFRQSPTMAVNAEMLFQEITNFGLEVGDIQEVATFGETTDAILNGDSVLILDGVAKALKMGTKGWKARDISEPITEGVVRGPRDGFTETLRMNTALLRRRIKSPNLKLEQFILGTITKTEINIAYLGGIADPQVIDELKNRLSRIEVDSILESAYIEELIEDEPYTLFPQIEHSERPDKVAAAILEGRIAVFVDGTPFVLLVPTILIHFFQSSEDYYERYPTAILVRTIRYVFQTAALLLPAFYIAVLNFHHEFIPTALLVSIAAGREDVPFPAFIEALIMEITFEALREAGVRLPRPVGQAISIVGALVIGEAAVQAGIVSPAMVIVVALTAIASFTIPAYNLAFAFRIIRFIMMLLASILGFYGIMLGMLVLNLHVISLRSFGVPYFSTLAPFNWQDFKDVFIRAPWWAMGERSDSVSKINRRRQKFFLKPHKPQE